MPIEILSLQVKVRPVVENGRTVGGRAKTHRDRKSQWPIILAKGKTNTAALAFNGTRLLTERPLRGHQDKHRVGRTVEV